MSRFCFILAGKAMGLSFRGCISRCQGFRRSSVWIDHSRVKRMLMVSLVAYQVNSSQPVEAKDLPHSIMNRHNILIL